MPDNGSAGVADGVRFRLLLQRLRQVDDNDNDDTAVEVFLFWRRKKNVLLLSLSLLLLPPPFIEENLFI